MLIADLHIHSKYSRATSRDCDAAHLDLWARRKGIDLVGTGDFTHPGWRAELAEALERSGDGVYTLRAGCRVEDPAAAGAPPRFVVTGEISTIYKKDGRTRKVHSLILLPGLEEAEKLSRRLEAIGNLHSDGRPILGLDCRDLLEITLESCPEAVFIPAHIWTPHFSLFGAFSGFDAIEECFGDLTPHIHALETGLSSDPPMNWRLSALDSYHLVSNSDAHSPQKLGREANLLDIAPSYPSIAAALATGEGLMGTVEFFPEEGKYHFDGHRNCGQCLAPGEAEAKDGKCPVCGKRLTTGVLHRVEQLADRPEGAVRPRNGRPFQSLAPLPEVIAASLGTSPGGKGTERLYEEMLRSLGPEFQILREAPLEDVARVAGPCVAEGLRRLRRGQVVRSPGYDGQYGTITLLDPSEREALEGQVSLFGLQPLAARRHPHTRLKAKAAEKQAAAAVPAALNEAQRAAAQAPAGPAAVAAGPGTGKTRTLAARAAWLLTNGGVRASELAAVTFTNRAAAGLRSRLEEELGKRAIRGLTVGTFHAVCLSRRKPDRRLASPWEGEQAAAEVIRELGLQDAPRRLLERISRYKNGAPDEGFDPEIPAAYDAKLRALERMDFDDILLEALHDEGERGAFSQLLVDEFQDCSPLQYALIRHWCGERGGLFAIGDPDQAIYGFRGTVDGFEALRNDYPGLAVFQLQENYRSTPEILRCAQAALSPGGAVERRLEPRRPGGPKVRLVRAASARAEAIFAAKEINRMTGGVDMLDAARRDVRREKVRSFSDVALLCRTRRQLPLLEDCLAREGIPCVVAGREDFLDTPAVRRAVEHFQNLPEIPAGDPAALLKAWGESQGLSGEQNLDRLINMAVFFGDMSAFLENLTLGREGDLLRRAGASYDAGCVTLSTIHAAKGLEFPVVFLCGMEEGILPLEGADEAEERRLTYVGMTRAAEELVLLTASTPSRFLSDLPREALAEERAEAPAAQAQLSLF